MTSKLFTPITLRGLELANRIVVSPMCQYTARDGTAGDWHLMHLGQFAVSGAGLVFVEATGVAPEGRITPGCVGLYSDENEAALARIVEFCRAYGNAKLGLQLAHAGRKASSDVPWRGGRPLAPDDGGWQTVAPSALPYAPGGPAPAALDGEGLARVRDAFVKGAERALRLDFDLIEIHAAHGYLLHQFLSPLSNRREDTYGGSLENRMRFPLEVFAAVRRAWPEDRPLGIRISARDWIDGGWDLDGSIALAAALKERGCDFIDVSSGGLGPAQAIEAGPGYQAGFAAEVKRQCGLATIAVGQVTDPRQAETIVRSGQADMVALARMMLYNPRWPWHAAEALGAQAAFPPQYQRSHPSLQGEPIPGNPPPAKT
jgi:2,4-dienoyl-CoA reductase-like NADH-dependent reductase (Old Yellow Enzyme family)